MVLVTGATGKTGGATVAALVRSGVTPRALVRDEAKTEGVRAAGAEPVTGDLSDPSSLGAALDGVDHLFLVTPTSPEQAEQEGRVIDAAKSAGVGHVVMISAEGTSPDSPVRLMPMHHESEQYLQASGLDWTILRPNGFMENQLNWLPQLESGDTVYWPVIDARHAMIAVDDIGEVAALALTEEGHAGQTYDLTGPEAVSYRDAAARLAAAAGRPIELQEIPVSAAVDAMEQAGLPPWYAAGLGELYELYADGQAEGVSGDVERVLGRPPRDFDAFARDHAEVFARR